MIDQNEVEIDQQVHIIYRKKEQIDSFEVSKLLDSPIFLPAFYWHGRDTETEIFAFGELLFSDKIPHIQTVRVIEGEKFEPPFLGHLKYEFHNGYEGHFSLPTVVIEKLGEELTLTRYSKDKTFAPLDLTPSKLTEDIPLEVLDRDDAPNEERWVSLVNQSLERIKKELFSKVVLARRSEFTLSSSLLPSTILKHLKLKQKNCSLFSFQYQEGSVFLGATPEFLYRRSKNILQSEALAGTCPLDSPGLLNSKKELYEFNIVKNDITRMLHSICSKVKQLPNHMVSTGSVQHIHSGYVGHLKVGIKDHAIASLLHPTPAICGTPRVYANRFIQENEPFTRNMYAAPLGLVTESNAQVVVGIRSALIEAKKLIAYAGCGLIEGSDPVKEWQELESKIAPYVNFLKYAEV